MLLSDIVQILSGVAFRSRIENQRGGAWTVIQARDLTEDGKVDLPGAARIDATSRLVRGLVEAGDVVLQPRGNRYSAGKVGEVAGPTVAAAPLYVLRRRSPVIDPDFLVAFLLAPSTQAALRQDAVGTYVPQVPRQALENLNIDLPDLSQQTRLAELAHLMRRENELVSQLSELRARLFDLAMRESAKKGRKRANASGPSLGHSGARTP